MRILILVVNLIAAVVLLELGSGLQGVLVPIRGEAAGFATPVIGALGTTYYVGFVAGCLLLPRLVERFGHIRCYAALAAVSTSAVLLHALFVVEWAWLTLRLLFGFSFAGLFMVVESWLNDQTTSESRGRVLGTYMVATWIGVIGGKMLFAVETAQPLQLFSLAAIAIALSIVPVALTTGAVPSIPHPARLSLGELYRLAPVGLVGCFGVGIANGAFWTFSPLFAQAQTDTALHVSLFMSACVLGGMASQWPLGWLSDRVDRRAVILGAFVAAAAAGVVLAVQTRWVLPPSTMFILGGLYGAASLAIYSVCVAHANDRADPDAVVAVSSHLLFAFGFGAIVGPFIASLVIDRIGIGALFGFTAAVHAVLATFAAVRIRRAEPVAEAARTPFTPAPPAGQGTHAAAALDPAADPASVTGDGEAGS